jgi:hypothetical protein
MPTLRIKENKIYIDNNIVYEHYENISIKRIVFKDDIQKCPYLKLKYAIKDWVLKYIDSINIFKFINF